MFALSTKTILGTALAGVQSWCAEGFEAFQSTYGLPAVGDLRHQNPRSIRNLTCESPELGPE
jgi:hypothetical protein